MKHPPSPHFLRVVQALALVSGVGSVALVSGDALLGCGGSTSREGVQACGGHVCGVIVAPSDAAADGDAYTGVVTGTQPSCELDEAGTCIDGSFVGGGIQIPPDAGSDVQLVGGPLSPPELPA